MKKRGYRFTFFDDEIKGSTDKHIYLRHDLDTSIEKAVLISDIERSMGAKATYCIRFASPFYNIFSKKNMDSIQKIVSRGHQIALHYERESWNGILDEEILRELEILKKYFPIKNIVSFHRPQEDILGKHLENYINTYDKGFFKLPFAKYLSDSPANWREGCICEWLQKKEEPNYQVLTHPIWWGRQEGNPSRHLHDFMKNKLEEWDQEFYDDNPFYTERLDENSKTKAKI